MKGIAFLTVIGALALLLGVFVNATSTYYNTPINASYPDERDVNNLTMIYDAFLSNNLKFFLFWDEVENYTYGGNIVESSEIMVSASEDFVNWTGARKDIVISYKDGTDARNPSAAVDRYGTIYVLWEEMNKTSLHWEIYYGLSYDGINWTSTNSNHLVSNNRDDKVTDCKSPKVAVDSSPTAHAVWIALNVTTNSWELYYGKYLGGNWSSEFGDYIISKADKYNVTSCDILVDTQDNIWVFWTEFNETVGNDEVYAACSSDYGQSWTTEMISYPGGNNSMNVTATKDAFNIYVFWEQKVGNSTEIMVSVFNGTDWSGKYGDRLVSFPDGYDARHPAASASLPGIFVVWDEYDENTNARQIMISNSTDGINWSGAQVDAGDIPITNTSTEHQMPGILVNESGELFIVWEEWIEYKQRGSREVFVLNAPAQEIVPEIPYIYVLSALVAVHIYAVRKISRLRDT